MKIIRNKYIPFKGFCAMYFFGLLFVREEYSISSKTMRHEAIHHEQAKELLFIFFYILYILEWFVRLFINGKEAYRNISFEKEAYNNSDDCFYLANREKYSFLKYLKDEKN